MGKPSKIEGKMRAGIFLDYYVAPDGRFTYQYVCAPLEDFVGQSLHRVTGRSTFRIHLHRTEVLRRPADVTRPVFPLRIST